MMTNFKNKNGADLNHPVNWFVDRQLGSHISPTPDSLLIFLAEHLDLFSVATFFGIVLWSCATCTSNSLF